MFGGRDPFDSFGQMRRGNGGELDQMFGMMNQMDQMMNQMLGGAFGHPAGYSGGGHSINQPGGGIQNQLAPQRRRDALGLFGGGGMMNGFMNGGMLGNMMMGSGMMMENAMNDPNSMVFSQSTMITMNPDGTRRVVSNSTRKAGDVKETRTALREGEKEKVAIGHHIGARTHVIEKKRDRDGRFRQTQKFVNLDEEDAANFNAEFRERAARNLDGIFGAPRASNGERRAIEIGASGGLRSNGVATSAAPIITIPDDDEEDDEEVKLSKSGGSTRRHAASRRSQAADDANFVRSNTRGAPQIRELTEAEDAEDEAEERGESGKRRRGLLGNFFRPNER